MENDKFKMKIIFKAYYDIYELNGELIQRCIFIDEHNNEIHDSRIYEYLIYVMTGDLYLQKDIDENLALIYQAKNNPNETYSGGGQGFCWEISAEKVVFYNNEFDADDGWSDLSCSLSMFKTTLIAWNAFLQLPKSIHSVLTTEICEQAV